MRRSGKLKVLREMLTMWKAQGHKYLVFSQTRQVLDIIELMVSNQLDLTYSRIDGSTPVKVLRTETETETERRRHKKIT